MSASRLQVLSSALSDTGRKRERNEDCYLLDPVGHVYLLADGMGGHLGGDQAARVTVDTVHQFIQVAENGAEMTWPFGYRMDWDYEENVLLTALHLANDRVLQTAAENELWGMGSTLALLWLRGSRALYCNVGDSRIYLFRKGDLRQLSEDHTLVQEQLSQGLISPQEATTHPLRHIVTHAIGSQEAFRPEISSRTLEKGDCLMLCSDGLTDSLEEGEIARLLTREADLDEACRTLVEQANRAGGEDNITVVLLKIVGRA